MALRPGGALHEEVPERHRERERRAVVAANKPRGCVSGDRVWPRPRDGRRRAFSGGGKSDQPLVGEDQGAEQCSGWKSCGPRGQYAGLAKLNFDAASSRFGAVATERRCCSEHCRCDGDARHECANSWANSLVQSFAESCDCLLTGIRATRTQHYIM
jgi:hypothetical protein